MFNFLVTGSLTGGPRVPPRGWVTMGADRILGYTNQEIEALYMPGNVLDQQAVMRLPTIFTDETSHDPENPTMARIGTITRIRPGTKQYEIEYSFDQDIAPIPNAVLESLATDLDFNMSTGGFKEFQTNHWAIKDADLFRVLFKHGIGRRADPKVFRLTEEPVDEGLVAVMMPFDSRFDGVYTALQNAVGAAGMRCQRADDIWVHDHVIQDVVSLIGKARVVICDLTGRNANVFYEMGIAHTLGRDVIMVTQSKGDVPFDVGHIRYVPYLPNNEGLAALSGDITKRLATIKSLKAV